MLARIHTSSVSGLTATPIEVEVEVYKSSEDEAIRHCIIGMGDAAVREARDRVITALRNSGFSFTGRVLISLAPAELKKEGSSFDLAMALGILIALQKIPRASVTETNFYGELALDGSIKSVRGVLAHTAVALERQARVVVVPQANIEEAALMPGIGVLGADNLAQVVEYLRGDGELTAPSGERINTRTVSVPRLSEVWGQQAAKRALLVAAAGGHNLLMIGPPGCGKSMLAARMPAILPPLTPSERLEAVKIHSVAGLELEGLFAGLRPFRAPHHTVSDAGLIGGGSVPKPGEITLAHHGVLFLDEFPEFRRSALEGLRAPLESGQVLISRARGSLMLPARLQLIAAMNPCPCGRLGNRASAGARRCECSLPAVQSYLRKLSGPILDRIDLHIDLEAVPLDVMAAAAQSSCASGASGAVNTPDSEVVKVVHAARALQIERQGCCNAHLAGEGLGPTLRPTKRSIELLKSAAKRLEISGRGFIRILRVARTLADLEAAPEIEECHIAEAVNFRSLERLIKYCDPSRPVRGANRPQS